VAQLSTTTTSPGVESTLVGKGDGMCITTGNLDHFYGGKKVDQAWSRLVRITLDVGGKIFHRREAKLPARTGTPRVDIAFDVYSDCVPVTTSDLIHTFVAQLLDFQRVGLQDNRLDQTIWVLYLLGRGTRRGLLASGQ